MKACHLSMGIWCRAAPITFLEDFIEVTTGTGIERLEAPIVEDEKLDAGKIAKRLS